MLTTLLDDSLYIVIIILIVVIPLGFYATYRASQKRVRDSQYEAACVLFKKTVSTVDSRIPDATEYWDNIIIDQMPYVTKILDRAVLQLIPFLTPEKSSELEKEWLSSKNFIGKKLAEELIAAGLMYGSSVASTSSAKEEFHKRVKLLLKYVE